MNDYLPSAYKRLLSDGLIGADLHKNFEGWEERDFHFWQAETHMPSVVNTYVHNLGKGK